MRRTKSLPDPIQHRAVCAVCGLPILPDHEVWMWTPVMTETGVADFKRGYAWHIEHGDTLPKTVYRLSLCPSCQNASRWARRRCKVCSGAGERIDLVLRQEMSHDFRDEPLGLSD